jgi:lipoyl(octanoyl) transferase
MKPRYLGRQDYVPCWEAMQTFTDERDESTADEIWFCEHSPVFTLGLNAGREHVLAPGDIPIVQIDRGGQVTYHGPGMLMIYPLIDIRRGNIGVRGLVTALEQSVVDLVAGFGIEAAARPHAPGVYVNDRKLASVGLRIRRGASFHGMALNVDCDLEPFSRINPCGFEGLQMTDLKELGIGRSLEEVAQLLLPRFADRLGLLVDAN